MTKNVQAGKATEPKRSTSLKRRSREQAGLGEAVRVHVLRDNSNLVKHQRRHTGEKPYACTECGEKVHRQLQSYRAPKGSQRGEAVRVPRLRKELPPDILVTHQRVHSGERPHQCTEYGKRFSRGAHLATHQRAHRGERPYACSKCRRRFTQISNLIAHRRAHMGLRPYSCSQCGKSYTQRSNLTEHRRTHTGERPYVCAECGKSFGQNSSLMERIKDWSVA